MRWLEQAFVLIKCITDSLRLVEINSKLNKSEDNGFQMFNTDTASALGGEGFIKKLQGCRRLVNSNKFVCPLYISVSKLNVLDQA